MEVAGFWEVRKQYAIVKMIEVVQDVLQMPERVIIRVGRIAGCYREALENLKKVREQARRERDALRVGLDWFLNK